MKRMKKLGIVKGICILFLLSSVYTQGQSKRVPGTVVDYIPASTNTYIGSPSICILPNGDYIASHDYFGAGSTEHEQALTAVFKSTDKGKSWKKISEINGQFWSNLFIHQNALYIMGTWKHYGDFIIRRSLDGGTTWSNPIDSQNGLLLTGEYHTAPMPVIKHNGRLWRAIENAKSPDNSWGKRFSAVVISAPVDTDLLQASNWSTSNGLPYDSTYLDGKFGGWLEGNVVITPEGKMVNILRVATSEKGRDMAAVLNVSEDGLNLTFDPSTGFMDFVGGARKFSIRYDEQSNHYYALANLVKDEFAQRAAGSVRNTLVLKSSRNLKNWSIHTILLQHPDVEKHGFQYIDWQFDGRDIIFVSRTAYDDKSGGARNFHDANYLTFHRIKNFRKLLKKSLRKNTSTG